MNKYIIKPKNNILILVKWPKLNLYIYIFIYIYIYIYIYTHIYVNIQTYTTNH